MEYGKEPFQFKLFIRKMLGKWYQFLACTLLGALLFGSCYYLYKVVYAPAREYHAQATYYIEYAKDPVLAEPYSYFNEYTLNSWLTMDVFTDKVLSQLQEKITVEQLGELVTLTLPADVRIMQLDIETNSPVLTMELLQAYDSSLQEFAQNQKEVAGITVQDKSEEAYQIKADIRTRRAFVLGGVLGLLAGGMVIILRYLLDDGIYEPGQLAARHGLKVLGTSSGEELAANVAYAVRSGKRIAVTGIGESPELKQVTALLSKLVPEKEWIAVPCMVQCPEAAETLRTMDGLILTVVSEKDKSAAIDRALRYYEQQQISVTGAILWGTDENC